MEQWELAVRRYRQIVPKPAVTWDQVPRPKLVAWLNQDVCAAIEQYVGRRRFRELASWPVRAFEPDGDSPELQLVADMDSHLAAYAGALVKFAKCKLLAGKLRELYPPRSVPATTEVLISAGRPVEQVLRRRSFDETALLRNQAAELSHRRRPPLVNILDYFDPQAEWVGTGRRRIQRGDLIRSLQPDLPAIGNMVVWALLRRIELRLGILDRLTRMCLTASRHFSRRYEARVTELSVNRQSAHDRRDSLRNEFQMGPECLLREHCIILTQVYAAFHPKPDLAWLGLSEPVIQSGRDAVRAWLSQFRNNELTERIAAALPDLSRLYVDAESGQSEIEETIASGGLVIVEDRAQAHWNTELVALNPQRNRLSWKLLVQLARKARMRSAVSESDIYDNPKGSSALAMAVHRLQEILPPNLEALIVPGNQKHTHRLDLPSRSIHIFNRGRRTR
jgi:hypothetical protein